MKKLEFKSLFAMCLVAAVVSACSQHSANNPSVEGGAADSKVIGGTEVATNDGVAKSVVLLQGISVDDQKKENVFICTGALIAKNKVLTAAHCVENNVTALAVIFVHDMDKAERANARKVVAVTMPAERKVRMDNLVKVQALAVEAQTLSQKTESAADIAAFEKALKNFQEASVDLADLSVVKFEGDLPSDYSPAVILPNLKNFKAGLNVTLIGYGVDSVKIITGADGKPETQSTGSGILRTTDVAVAGALSETEFAIDQRNNKGVCFGDSGGPGFVQIENQNYIAGVVSRGTDETCSEIGIYTSVVPYLSFINNAVQKL